MLPEPLRVTLRVTEVLEELNVQYLIGGSFASTLYGMVRMTQDVDLVTAMQSEHLSPFVTHLQGEFYVDEEMIRAALKNRSSFNIIHRESMFKVDIFVPPPRPFYLSQMARAQRQIFLEEEKIGANFATPEDTILAKLEWYRLGNEISERQWRDVLGILKAKQGDLEEAYLQKWAGELGVSDLLIRAFQETKS